MALECQSHVLGPKSDFWEASKVRKIDLVPNLRGLVKSPLRESNRIHHLSMTSKTISE
jgi:hypothetical protein